MNMSMNMSNSMNMTATANSVLHIIRTVVLLALQTVILRIQKVNRQFMSINAP